MRKIFVLVLFLAWPAFAQNESEWVLTQSTVTYHVSHPLHQVAGTSHEARGKGVCHAGQCDLLIVVPVRSFDSGDSNRDLHMLQVTRGGQFPLISVRTHLPEEASGSAAIQADLQVDFAGQTARYDHVSFQQTMQGADRRISGTIPLTLSDFKIEAPTLLSLPIKNQVPVQVEMTWRKNK